MGFLVVVISRRGAFDRGSQTIEPAADLALMELLTAGFACNDSRLTNQGEGWVLEGDPTEGALISSALKAGLSFDSISQQLPLVDTIAFESRYQYMATLHNRDGKAQRLYLKGSFESLIKRSANLLGAKGEQLPFDEQEVAGHLEKWQKKECGYLLLSLSI